MKTSTIFIGTIFIGTIFIGTIFIGTTLTWPLTVSLQGKKMDFVTLICL